MVEGLYHLTDIISSLFDSKKVYAKFREFPFFINLVQNPLPYLSRFPEADILTSSDELVPTVTDDSLEDWKFGRFHEYSLCSLILILIIIIILINSWWCLQHWNLPLAPNKLHKDTSEKMEGSPPF